MTYSELTEKLQSIEKSTGIYLSDTAVDLQNAADPKDDRSLFAAAASAAGDRASEAGLDINELVGAIIY